MTFNPIPPAVRDLSKWLCEQEVANAKPLKSTRLGVCYVCNKLCIPLSSLMGDAGYKSLVSRALALAKKEFPELDAYQVHEEGHIELQEGIEPRLGIGETKNAEIILVAHLIGLLILFIGENLTLDLIHGVWPNAPFNGSESGAEGKP